MKINYFRKNIKWALITITAFISLCIFAVGIIFAYLAGTNISFSMKTEKFFNENRDEFEDIIELCDKYEVSSISSDKIGNSDFYLNCSNYYVYFEDDKLSNLLENEEKELGEILSFFRENYLSYFQIYHNSRFNDIETLEFGFFKMETIFLREYWVHIIKVDRDIRDINEDMDYADKMWSPRKIKLVDDVWILVFDTFD